MDKFELRRLDLIELRDSIGFGAYRVLAETTGIDQSYLSRCAYPEGKKGKKNIGDDTVGALDKAYPFWRKRELESLGIKTLSETASYGSGDDTVTKIIERVEAAECSAEYTTVHTEQEQSVMDRFHNLKEKEKLELIAYLDYLESK